jgi:TrmH family RNA methyltransferase
MLSKKDIQFIRSLTIKKYRQKYHKYLAEGEKISLEIIRHSPERLDRLFCLSSFYEQYQEEINGQGLPFTLVTPRELAAISQLKTPNQVLALMDRIEPSGMNMDKEDGILVYLDRIRDPGNLGTLLRSAEWFGLDSVLLSPECVDIYSPKVVQATMGSLFRINHQVVALKDFLAGSAVPYTLYFAEMHGANAFETTFHAPMILVLGNESRGITLNLGNRHVQSIRIPGKGKRTESLNVSVAGSILMAEMTRNK